MPPAYALSVNRNAYSYRDIKPGGLPGMERLKTHLRAINFANAAESEHAHGGDQAAYGPADGPYKPTCEIELAEEGVDTLLTLLPARGFSLYSFTWELLYAKAQTVPPFKRLRFRDFKVLGSRGDWQQGTTPLSRRIPCYVRIIEEDIGDGIWRCPVTVDDDEIEAQGVTV